MPAGGIITLRTCKMSLESPRVFSGTELPSGEYVCLEVQDTGEGIPPEYLPHIFEPFFTTKPVGKGTGLGLATVYGIVLSHGGGIEVQSTPREGTSFRILLPAFEGKAEDYSSPERQLPEHSFHGTRILFVDDEESIRALVAEILQREGCQVQTAAGGEDALNLVRQHGASYYQLLITDLTMPGLDGIQLAREVYQLDPRLPIVLCSGYGTEVAQQVGEAPNVVECIQKPYRRKQLLDVIQHVLER